MNFIGLFCVIMWVGACTTTKVHSEKDVFQPMETHSTDSIALSTQVKPNKHGLYPNAGVEVAFQRIDRAGHPSTYNIRAIRSQEGGFTRKNFGGKDSLIIKAGHHVFTYSTNDRSNQNTGEGVGAFGIRYTEQVTYQNIPARDVVIISKAENPTIRLISTQGNVTGYIVGQGKEALVNLVAVPNHWAVRPSPPKK